MAPKEKAPKKGVAQAVKPPPKKAPAKKKVVKDDNDLNTWTIADLKDELRTYDGATVGGNKSALITRLLEYRESRGGGSKVSAPTTSAVGKANKNKTPEPETVSEELEDPEEVEPQTKKAPKNGHKAKGKKKKADDDEDGLGVPKKPTAAEAKRAQQYQEEVIRIMGIMREENGGPQGVRKSMFGPAYDDLVRANDLLDELQEAAKVAAGSEVAEPAGLDDKSEQKGAPSKRKRSGKDEPESGKRAKKDTPPPPPQREPSEEGEIVE